VSIFLVEAMIDKLSSLGLSHKEMNFVIEYTKEFDPSAAALRSGYKRNDGPTLLSQQHIQRAIENVLSVRLTASDITAEWVLMQAVDNHLLARSKGNLNASNAALMIVAKHKFVNAHTPDDDTNKQVVIHIDGKLQNV
jgi:phage terminase small subunit